MGAREEPATLVHESRKGIVSGLVVFVVSLLVFGLFELSVNEVIASSVIALSSHSSFRPWKTLFWYLRLPLIEAEEEAERHRQQHRR